MYERIISSLIAANVAQTLVIAFLVATIVLLVRRQLVTERRRL